MVQDAPRVISELEHMVIPFSRTTDGRIAQRNFGGHTRDYGKRPVKRACYTTDWRMVEERIPELLNHQGKEKVSTLRTGMQSLMIG